MPAFELGHMPLILVTVLWLVFLEGLLSADNALVLAMMVRHLPKPLQKRALRYGIWGAWVFRAIAIFFATYLLKFWFLKVVGGLYLLYLAVAHFLSDRHDEAGGASRMSRGFWGTVISVEIADIAFSIDSILAAVALADGLPDDVGHNERYFIVLTGGVLGILTMRFVAGYFIILLDKFRGLETGAYGLVAWIGLKLVVGGLHQPRISPYEMNDWIFWLGMLAIVAFSFIYRPPARSPEETAETTAVIQQVARMTGGDPGNE